MVKAQQVANDIHSKAPRALTIAIFEDVLDACDAIEALAKAGYGADQIAVMARDQEADLGDQADRHVTLAQALVGTGLKPVAGRISSLIFTIVPERGSFLAAGDIAHTLLDLGQSDTAASNVDLGAILQQVFVELGFSVEEAGFLDARLTNGSLLVGLAGVEDAALGQARELLAERDATHLGQGSAVLPAVDERMRAALPPDAGLHGDMIVSDGLARFIPLCLRGDAEGPWPALCGATVTDASGNELGEIMEVFVEPADGFDLGGGYEPRYAVLKHGGMLGMLQRLTVLPIELIELDDVTQAVRAAVDYDVLNNAATFDPDLPLSRREEQAICAYFGVIPRWAVSGDLASP